MDYEKNPEKAVEGADEVLVYLPGPDSAPDSPVPTIFEKPAAKKEAAAPEIKVDPLTLKALKDAKSSGEMVWEVDAFFNLDLIGDDQDRPYWLRTVIVAHRASGFIFRINVIEPEAGTCEAVAQNIFETIKKYDQKPSELHIRDAVLSKALGPIARELGISVKLKKQLPVIMKIKKEMSGSLHP
ncbi:MAG: hypothetical protein HQK85_05695 [Nitrospinae bacterium]|nr:hypothetical protein [Nitrospinota bacterium]